VRRVCVRWVCEEGGEVGVCEEGVCEVGVWRVCVRWVCGGCV